MPPPPSPQGYTEGKDTRGHIQYRGGLTQQQPQAHDKLGCKTVGCWMQITQGGGVVERKIDTYVQPMTKEMDQVRWKFFINKSGR